MHAHVTGAADVIRKRKTALETSGPYRPFQWFDQFARLIISERLHGNSWYVAVRLFQAESRHAGDRRLARRQRIARILKKKLNRTTLPRSHRTPGSFRIDLALNIAVIRRIGINDATGGAMILRHLGLHSAK